MVAYQMAKGLNYLINVLIHGMNPFSIPGHNYGVALIFVSDDAGIL